MISFESITFITLEITFVIILLVILSYFMMIFWELKKQTSILEEIRDLKKEQMRNL